MQSKLTKIFKNAKYEPEPDLAFSVLYTIFKKEKSSTRIKLWSLSFVLFLSTIGLIPAFEILLNNLAHSGFYEYFSLIFSDSKLIFSYWKELIFSIAQSLPVMSIVLSLSLIFVFFLSLKYAMRQINKGHLISSEALSI